MLFSKCCVFVIYSRFEQMLFNNELQVMLNATYMLVDSLQIAKCYLVANSDHAADI
jgi:hypothetical protein